MAESQKQRGVDMSGFSRKDKMLGLMIFTALALLVLSWAFVSPSPRPVQAAVITPVTQTARDGSRVAEFFVTRAITEDTRVCFDLAEFEVMDLQYKSIAASGALSNPTTITTQQTNIDPTSGPFNAGSAVATVQATSADTMFQTPLFGRWNCVYANVTNSNPVTLTIIGVAK